MFKFLLQSEDVMREEKQIITQHCSKDFYCYVSYDQIQPLDKKELIATIPVGTVEFIRKFADLNGIKLPDESISYPDELKSYLGRSLYDGIFSEVGDEQFCKPKRIKAFTGALKKDISEHVDPDLPVWISDRIDISSEWRYYILEGKILGKSRYDSGDNDDCPDEAVVADMIADFKSAPIAYSLDVGTSNGNTILIEVNDAWALGYYRWGDMAKTSYMKLIIARWLQIVP